jgi:hypothetical protein
MKANQDQIKVTFRNKYQSRREFQIISVNWKQVLPWLNENEFRFRVTFRLLKITQSWSDKFFISLRKDLNNF